jgi:hypothetical protein
MSFVGTKYHSIFSGGDYCADNKRMYIRLYPNNQNTPASKVEDPNSTLNQAIKSACDQLLNYGAINYYEVLRFHAEDYYYPCIDSNGDISGQLSEYLKGTADKSCSPYPNGTGDDLLTIRGAHLLVHNNDCTTSYVSATAGNQCSDSAFNKGRMCWTSATCTDDSKVKAGAIQEPLHQFIMYKQSQVYDLLQDDESGDGIDHKDEHSLGRVDSNYNITPMLAFHGSEFSKDHTCNDSAYDLGANHVSTLTSCTKKAVKYIAEDSDCNDLPLDRVC